MDWQFLPRGILDALAYPFYWLVGDNRSSEYPFRDARFAVATVLIVLGIGRSLITRTDIFTRRDTQFLLFFAVSYATWLAVFSIQRYAIVLERCGALIVLLIARSMAGAPGPASLRTSPVRTNAVILPLPWPSRCGRNRETGSAAPGPTVQPDASRNPSSSPRSIFFSTSRWPMSPRCCRRSRGSIRSPTLPCPSCPTASSTAAFDRVARSAAGRRMGIAHARQADPRTIAGAIWSAGRCIPRLRRNRRRVAGDSHRGMSVGRARKVARGVPPALQEAC